MIDRSVDTLDRTFVWTRSLTGIQRETLNTPLPANGLTMTNRKKRWISQSRSSRTPPTTTA